MTETERIYRVALEAICDLSLDGVYVIVEAMDIAREALAEARRLKREAAEHERAKLNAK